MRALLAKLVLAGLGCALPLWAFGQALPMPAIPPVQAANHVRHAAGATPVWQHDGNSLSVTTHSHADAAAPAGAAALGPGQTYATSAGIQLATKPGLTAHAGVDEVRWAPALATCTPGTVGCRGLAPAAGLQRGEVGAGYAGHGVKLDLSIGQAHSEASNVPVRARRLLLPRVLPAAGGADVAAPLWFRNSTATSLNARGQVKLAPDTSLDLGASVGRVRLLPSAGLTGDDTLDQTTLSLGIQHGAVRGAIVGHMLEPDLPGATLSQDQRWSGIDLGISARLPWRGELNFGVQNLWTSGHSSFLFGPGATTPDQGRVPYIQYHQDL